MDRDQQTGFVWSLEVTDAPDWAVLDVEARLDVGAGGCKVGERREFFVADDGGLRILRRFRHRDLLPLPGVFYEAQTQRVVARLQGRDRALERLRHEPPLHLQQH